eukprot:scaffold200767_cov46-Prasinocladus_malaysianus.AAC.1
MSCGAIHNLSFASRDKRTMVLVACAFAERGSMLVHRSPRNLRISLARTSAASRSSCCTPSSSETAGTFRISIWKWSVAQWIFVPPWKLLAYVLAHFPLW